MPIRSDCRGVGGGPTKLLPITDNAIPAALAPDQPLSEQVVPIEVHHLIPGAHEVTDEFFFHVIARVDLRQRPELGVRAEHEVGGRCGPLHLAGRTVCTLVHVLLPGRRSPGRAHVEQVHEEVIADFEHFLSILLCKSSY